MLIKKRKISFENSEEKIHGIFGNGFSNKKIDKNKRLERVGENAH